MRAFFRSTRRELVVFVQRARQKKHRDHFRYAVDFLSVDQLKDILRRVTEFQRRATSFLQRGKKPIRCNFPACVPDDSRATSQNRENDAIF